MSSGISGQPGSRQPSPEVFLAGFAACPVPIALLGLGDRATGNFLTRTWLFLGVSIEGTTSEHHFKERGQHFHPFKYFLFLSLFACHLFSAQVSLWSQINGLTLLTPPPSGPSDWKLRLSPALGLAWEDVN